MWRGWIKSQGIRYVAEELGCTYETVRAWVNDGMMPKDKHKKKLVLMAQGEFGFSDFFKEIKA